MQNAIQNASLFSCQRSLCPELLDRPAPGGTFTPFTTRQNNKKPGVERRAKPSAHIRTGSRDARLICYPEFVIDLACDRSLETLNAPDNYSATTAIRQTNREYIRFFSLVKRSFSRVLESCEFPAAGAIKAQNFALHNAPKSSVSAGFLTSWRLRRKRFARPHCRPDRSSYRRRLRGSPEPFRPR